MTRAFSGRDSAGLQLDQLAADELGADDVRIHPDTLRHQAQVAQEHDNPQLAANFARAAELALMPEAEVLALYEALRPHRATGEELDALTARLEEVPAPLCAQLVREAAEIYARRGLLA